MSTRIIRVRVGLRPATQELLLVPNRNAAPVPTLELKRPISQR